MGSAELLEVNLNSHWSPNYKVGLLRIRQCTIARLACPAIIHQIHPAEMPGARYLTSKLH